MEKNVKKRRSIFVTANKYQEQIILAALQPFIIVVLIFLILTIFGNLLLVKNIFHITLEQYPYILLSYAVFMAIVLFIVAAACMVRIFKFSNKLVGFVERVTKELDDIIDGKSKKLISIRPNEDLSKNLVKRINILVKAYTEKTG